MTNFEKQKTKWEKRKSKGKRRYVLLIVGIYELAGLSSATMIRFIYRLPVPSVLSLLIVLAFYVICWGLGGLIVGFIGWNKQVQKFDK